MPISFHSLPELFLLFFLLLSKALFSIKAVLGKLNLPTHAAPETHTHTERERERDKRNTNTSHSCSDMSSVCLLSLANRQLELSYKESKTEKQTYQTGERGGQRGKHHTEEWFVSQWRNEPRRSVVVEFVSQKSLSQQRLSSACCIPPTSPFPVSLSFSFTNIHPLSRSLSLSERV